MIKHHFSKILIAFVFVLLLNTTKALSSSVVKTPQVSTEESARMKMILNLFDLDYKGLEQVKNQYNKGNYQESAKELLKYYRQATPFIHPSFSLEQVNATDADMEFASKGMAHIFYSVKGREPEFYGDEIDWTYWPSHDYEVRWQLHRMYWWQPMGKVYYATKDESYAKEWTVQYMDWITKNPMPHEEVKVLKGKPNSHFAWRPLEISHRIQDQIIQFQLFLQSDSFTPEFLLEFIYNYSRQADFIMANYTPHGNHLLFQAQRMIFAGICFPELKHSSVWRKSGITKLNEEIKKQVFEDGGHYELDLGYHMASINIFAAALKVANLNGYEKEFPVSFGETIRKMITLTYNTNFSNNTNPLFSDTRTTAPKVMLRNYNDWLGFFPNDEELNYFASNRKSGHAPTYLSKAFPETGYYVFRNDWNKDVIQMVLKAGEKAGWHNQPDNGTFELNIRGRNFFPDSGCYLYSGDAKINKEREWFRQTSVHNTLTLDGKNSNSSPKLLSWTTSDTSDVLSYVNESYSIDSLTSLSHTRTVHFIDKKFFVIIDEATGNAQGNVAIHYNFIEGKDQTSSTISNSKENSIVTTFNDGNDVVLKVFSKQNAELKKERGRVSYHYNKFLERDAYSFNVMKATNAPITYITVIVPTSNTSIVNKIGVKYKKKSIQLVVDGVKYTLDYPKSNN